jgi:glutathione S-transferase
MRSKMRGIPGRTVAISLSSLLARATAQPGDEEINMPALTLYHIAPSRSSTALWMLEEIGEPYGIHLLSMKKGDNREHPYLDINPMGKVPALKHGDVVITESAAICCYLADAFPQAGLNIPIDDPRRGPYLKWLFFGPSVVEPRSWTAPFPCRRSARARLWRFRHRDERAGGRGDAGAVPDGREVHRGCRHRRRRALGRCSS